VQNPESARTAIWASFDFADQSTEHAGRSAAGVDLARSQNRRDQLSAATVKDEQRMIDELVVEAAEEGQLLCAVGFVSGSVNIQDNHLRIGRQFGHVAVFQMPHQPSQSDALLRSFEPRQGRL